MAVPGRISAGRAGPAESALLPDTKVRDRMTLKTHSDCLEGLGFVVKGEVGGCDLVALKGDDPPGAVAERDVAWRRQW